MSNVIVGAMIANVNILAFVNALLAAVGILASMKWSCDH